MSNKFNHRRAAQTVKLLTVVCAVVSLVILVSRALPRGNSQHLKHILAQQGVVVMTPSTNNQPQPSLQKTDAEWREQLSPQQYHVTREKGTERAFTGEFWDIKTPGKYHCVCCGAELFASEAKYDSGCGWPSFTAPADKPAIAYHDDNSHSRHRVEVTCSKCGAHLGHVFEDGPGPTGLRYCINSASLKLAPKEAREHAKK